MGVYKDLTEEDFKEVTAGFVKSARDELLSKSKEQLVKDYWYFEYDPSASKEWNLYQFMECANLFKKKCREWETHHNGYMSVVECVRDKYLMPKIKEFYAVQEFYAALETAEASKQ